jgi:para-aminobenzoate synthetase component 1
MKPKTEHTNYRQDNFLEPTTRHTARFPLPDLAAAKNHLLDWACTFPIAVYLDSNEYPADQHSCWECLVATGAAALFQAPAGDAFAGFKTFAQQKKDWLFGGFGYDLKNELERLQSGHPDRIGFPDLFFFQPETVAGIRRAAAGSHWEIEIHTLSLPPRLVWEAIQAQTPAAPEPGDTIALRPRIPKAEYLNTVAAIRQHIIDGDVYEMNLCQEFYAEQVQIQPAPTFRRLNNLTRAPFAAYLRWQGRHLLCASPERFLRKEGSTLVSQPIKGTRRRHPDPGTDALVRQELAQSQKDRAENVMIVDLVRNDLARHCLPGTVRVEELFGVYSFQTVHQLISTVAGTLRPGAHPLDALRDAFPMGSMTGAPKVMAMDLIERYERSRRGLYSGALGYCTPEGDFDFNVVIRSILYHEGAQYLSCQVGGAIVYDSVPEQEYEECLVKAAAMRKALENAT